MGFGCLSSHTRGTNHALSVNNSRKGHSGALFGTQGAEMYTGRSRLAEPAALFPTPATEPRPEQREPGTQRQGKGLRWWQNALIALLAVVLIVGGSAFGMT